MSGAKVGGNGMSGNTKKLVFLRLALSKGRIVWQKITKIKARFSLLIIMYYLCSQEYYKNSIL